ncbi:von Hippel-Lindau disease tumor suppressor [Lingula anatina]|uniref:von Hippel-Lindau disease tumor suppressor n=1 Tax=Lingula anatina TaxID=7574 RepID=A0A1S3IFU2_LINAN|nr:von Hippel-Lindau disease tumor suppressor [Lingula anatina]|eukprot:XP_013397018.1 von Hippel-Lindau disease tumor suppressor [Lingula anatina]
MSEDVTQGTCENTMLKSKNADVPAYVTFCNRTSRNVDIFWLNYKGKRVKYCNLSPQQRNFYVDTYVTHPWVFREAGTEYIMTANKKDVFFPKAWDGGQERSITYIDIPVYSLRERCIQVLRKLLPKECMEDLDIPKLLKQELLDMQCQSHDTYKSVKSSTP